MRAIVVGAGCGGAVAVHALRRVGISAKLFEKAPAIAPVGAAVTLAPNGLHALHSVSPAMVQRLQATSQPNLHVRSYTAAGRDAGGVDFSGIERKFGYPLLCLTRAALTEATHEGLEYGRDILLGKDVVDVVDTADGQVKVICADGTEEAADIVIGADGARSKVAKHVTGVSGGDALRPTGYVCTYGLTAAGSYPAAQEGTVSWVFGGGRSWGTWCAPEGRAFWFTVHRHGEVAGEVGKPEGGAWASGSDRLPAIRSAFAGCYHPAAGGFDAILAATDRASTFGLADKSVHTMATGRVALVGDAARTVTPWGGQGANQAIEDAVALARALKPLATRTLAAGGAGATAAASARPSAADVAAALKRYEEIRRGRSNFVADFSRQTGVLQMLPGRLGDGVRRFMNSMPKWATEASVGWLYGYRLPEQ